MEPRALLCVNRASFELVGLLASRADSATLDYFIIGMTPKDDKLIIALSPAASEPKWDDILQIPLPDLPNRQQAHFMFCMALMRMTNPLLQVVAPKPAHPKQEPI